MTSKEEMYYDKKDLIVFQEGIFGFEDQKEFLPLPVEENTDAVLSLQSIQDEEVGFIIMNPFLLKQDYDPILQAEDLEALNVKDTKDLSFYVIAVVKHPMEESTLNFKCPIVVNALTREARQVILEEGDYSFRETLKDLTPTKEA